MNLRSTPHIKIRRANGLNNIDYTTCDIIGLNDESEKAAARSYNTIIGVYARDSTGKKIYLETGGVYSTTTQGKHKPRARRIAEYNNFKVVSEILPEILHKLYFYNKYNIDAITSEAKERQEILKALYNNEDTAPAILHAKYKNIIECYKPVEKTQYKNGNLKNKYYCKVTFKYCYPIYYELNVKHIKKEIAPYYGRNGYKPATTTNTIIKNIVNIQE